MRTDTWQTQLAMLVPIQYPAITFVQDTLATMFVRWDSRLVPSDAWWNGTIANYSPWFRNNPWPQMPQDQLLMMQTVFNQFASNQEAFNFLRYNDRMLLEMMKMILATYNKIIEVLQKITGDDALAEQCLLGFMAGSMRDGEPKPRSTVSSSVSNG